MFILATEVNEEDGQYLSQKFQGRPHTLKLLRGPLDEASQEDLEKVEALMPFIHTKVRANEIDAMPNLKIIATRSTGFDHIDVDYAAEKGIIVTNVPGYGERAVAEFTFALMLDLSRKIFEAVRRTKQGDYTLEGLQGFDLYGKTLGVVGAGAIGLHVIRIAKGFGMNVVAYDVFQNRLISEILDFRYVDLDELFRTSDIITLHAPALPSTHHIINRESLSKVKRGTILINTARGSLVDTEALLWALNEGIISAAGLDALEGEEFLQNEEELFGNPDAADKLKLVVRNSILQRHPNVTITPHVAFDTKEALHRILDTTIDNVESFAKGKSRNIVKAGK
jgi:D-lactate dehydrogenase